MNTPARRRTRHGLGWHLGLLYGRVVTWVDHRVPWHRQPLPLGLLMLIGVRSRLRKENLFDTGTVPGEIPDIPELADSSYLTARTVSGHYNDLENPSMGSAGCRFGRNVPLSATFPETGSRLMTPNPRDVSRELLTRTTFQPATSLNLLAAAWLQFEVHDWFSHPKPSWDTAHRVALAPDDDWPEHPMRLPRAIPDPTWNESDGTPTTWVNEDTHWWDGSQVYGDTRHIADGLRAREDGKLLIDDDGLPPAALDAGLDVSGVAGNFWLGLGLLHGVFMREHNAICDMLKKNNPSWGDDRLYRTARLINAALMAKIHTVEWTPGIIAHPTTVRAMRTTWWGLAGEGVHKRRGRISRSDLISGIPGSRKNLFDVPYALTEEFGAVYRMHPLIPDDYTFRSTRRRLPAGREHLRGPDADPRPRADAHARHGQRALLLRAIPPGRDHAAQLPAVPAAPGAPGRHAPRPRRRRHHADPASGASGATTSSVGSCTSSRRRPSRT